MAVLFFISTSRISNYQILPKLINNFFLVQRFDDVTRSMGFKKCLAHIHIVHQ